MPDELLERLEVRRKAGALLISEAVLSLIQIRKAFEAKD